MDRGSTRRSSAILELWHPLCFCSSTCGIGLSRVYLGVHYPSDILGGFTAGFAWLMANILGYRDYQRRRRGGCVAFETGSGAPAARESTRHL